MGVSGEVVVGINIAVSAVRFLYAVTLGRETLDLMASVPHMKRATGRAKVYARSEVEAILTAPTQPRDRVLLMTVYACGLRISEAQTRHCALKQLESREHSAHIGQRPQRTGRNFPEAISFVSCRQGAIATMTTRKQTAFIAKTRVAPKRLSTRAPTTGPMIPQTLNCKPPSVTAEANSSLLTRARYTKRKKLYAKPHEDAPSTAIGTPTGRRGLSRP